MAAVQETGIGSVGAPRAGRGRQRDAANQAKQRSESKPRPPSQQYVGAQAQPYRSHRGIQLPAPSAVKDAGTPGAGWCCPHTALPRPSVTCQRADPAGVEDPGSMKRPRGYP